jgi:hypothetical protein
MPENNLTWIKKLQEREHYLLDQISIFDSALDAGFRHQINALHNELAELEGKLRRECDYIHSLESVIKLIRGSGSALKSTLDRIFERKHDLRIVLACELSSNCLYASEIITAIKSNNFIEAERLIRKILYSYQPEASKRRVTLLSAAVAAAQAETFFAWRQAHHKLIMLMAEYAYQGSQMMDKPDPEAQQAALDLYWYYRIILARAEGRLPAWEGIRLVRERR